MIEKKSGLTLIAITIFIIMAPIVNANIVDDLFSPLQGVNFSETYDTYSSIIDLIIYSILFIGLAQVTIGKRFEGRGGKAMVAAMGMVLAIGLTISESMLGFNLRSFGPLAAAIFIFLVGLMVFLGIKSFGMEIVGAASITIVITYLSIRSVTPGIFDWMIENPNLAWIHSVLLIAVLISLFKIAKIFFPSRKESSTIDHKSVAKDVAKKPRDFLQNIRKEKEESNFIKTKLKKITDDTGKDSKQIINDLTEIKKLVHESGKSEKGREQIARKVESLFSKEKEIHTNIKSLQAMVQRLANFDIKNFQQLQKDYNHMSSDQREIIEKEINLEWKKLNVEKQMLKLEQAIEEYEQSFNHTLELIIVSLRSDKLKNTTRQIDLAIKIERNVYKILKQMITFEKMLVAFSNKNVKELMKNI